MKNSDENFTPLKAAIDLIKTPVERGDSYEEIKNSFIIRGSSMYLASIGGYVKTRWISSKFIVVRSLNGSDTQCKVFDLQLLFESVKKKFSQSQHISNTINATVSNRKRDFVPVQQTLF